MFILSEEERRQQRSPLCKTPTSELLQMAAQFLPVTVEPPKETAKTEPPGNCCFDYSDKHNNTVNEQSKVQIGICLKINL